MENEEIAKKLSSSYAVYLKVNNQKEMNMLDESIEDTLTRLEELENGINMLQAQRERAATHDFTSARCNLNSLCQRVHKLDEMSKKVLEDVEALEVVVDEAEANLIGSPEGMIKSMLKPLFFMKSSEAVSPPQEPTSTNHTFSPQAHFSSSSFFTKPTEDESLLSNATFSSDNSSFSQ